MARRGLQVKRILLPIAMILVLLPTITLGPDHSLAQSASSGCLSADEALLLDRINTHRAFNGLAPLAASPTLATAARHHAESMATHNYFPGDYSVRFEGPDGNRTISWQQNIANAGYPDNTHTARSAIIGAGSQSVTEISRSLNSLPAYEQVLTDRRFQAIGIGFATNPDSDEGTYWAITLGSLVDSTIAPCHGVAVPLQIYGSGRTGNSSNSALAYDEDFETSWETTAEEPPPNAYVWFDLGSPVEVVAIEWMVARRGTADSFAIDVSLDGETWTQVAVKSNGAVNEWRSVRWRGTARFVRFFFANPNQDAVIGYLSEVRILH